MERIWPQKGLAPELYYCILVVGDVFTVMMMEHLKGSRLTHTKTPVTDSVFEDLEKTLVESGNAKLVHGNQRADIIADELGMHAKKVIDFDWSVLAKIARQDTRSRYRSTKHN